MAHAFVDFDDGPAKGKGLELARQPLFLRVEIGTDGRVDALDQPEDLPELGATLYVYERNPGVAGHILMSRPRRGMWMYRYHLSDAVEPTDDWTEWGRRVTAYCRARAASAASPLHAVDG
jgi:hypothetical protein